MKKLLTCILAAIVFSAVLVFPGSAEERLPAPVISSVTTNGRNVCIEWNSVENATHYNVFIYNGSGEKLVGVRTSATSYCFSDAEYGSYKVKIQALKRIDGKNTAVSGRRVRSFKVEKPVGAEPVIEMSGRKMHLTFDDEFDGDTLDASKWAYCPEWKRQDLNNYWDDSMTRLDGNGNLVLTISKYGDKYLSGAIRSKGIFEQAYGYFEIRCKLNTASGCWSAFWLECEGVNNVDGSGKDGAEIDIMESPKPTRSTISQGVIWDGYGPEQKSKGQLFTKQGLYDGFHTFALEWNEDEYIFYVDNEVSFRTSEGGVCSVSVYVKVSMETGSWTGLPSSTALPDSMIVDYVRVYQYEDRL